jgi:hypothetical protein
MRRYVKRETVHQIFPRNLKFQTPVIDSESSSAWALSTDLFEIKLKQLRKGKVL